MPLLLGYFVVTMLLTASVHLRARETSIWVHVERRERVGNRRSGDVRRGLVSVGFVAACTATDLFGVVAHGAHPLQCPPGFRRFACVGYALLLQDGA